MEQLITIVNLARKIGCMCQRNIVDRFMVGIRIFSSPVDDFVIRILYNPSIDKVYDIKLRDREHREYYYTINYDELIEMLKGIEKKRNNGNIEIFRLKEMLIENQIPFNFKTINKFNLGGYQLFYPSCDNAICLVIQSGISCGNEHNMLEIRGLWTEQEAQDNSVVGWLTAEEVFKRIHKDYCSINFNLE